MDERARDDTNQLLLAPVALLEDMPEVGLTRGQMGTVVEILDAVTFLVEFSDEQGRGYAIEPCARQRLLVLKTNPVAA